jgi:ABC-type multidrug transport system fused ATPase/permease subunit
LIQEALDRLLRGRTVLIIAHRLKLVYTADRVIVMQQGRAIEAGKPDVLLAQNGVYRRLVTSYEGRDEHVQRFSNSSRHSSSG